MGDLIVWQRREHNHTTFDWINRETLNSTRSLRSLALFVLVLQICSWNMGVKIPTSPNLLNALWFLETEVALMSKMKITLCITKITKWMTEVLFMSVRRGKSSIVKLRLKLLLAWLFGNVGSTTTYPLTNKSRDSQTFKLTRNFCSLLQNCLWNMGVKKTISPKIRDAF